MVEAVGVEAEADWDNLRSPETYLGRARGERLADGSAERLRLNEWVLAGDWTSERERVVLDSAGGSIAYRFHARDAHLVFSAGAGSPIPFRVLVDGEAPGAARGIDVDAEGHGVLDEGCLYQLVRETGEIRDRTVEISFAEPGAEAYVFTFG